MTSTYSPWAWSSPSPKSKPLDEKVLTTPTDSRLSSHTQDLDQFPPFASAHDAIPRRVSSALSEKGLAVSRDGIVSWQTDSKTHPRNWPLIRKIYDSMLICTLEFVMTLISNTGSAVAKSAKDDLHVTEELAILSLVTTYLVGQAVGGLLFPPIAENFGGRAIYVCSTLLFAILSLVMALTQNLPAILVGRTITGVLSAIPAVVAASSIENMWDIKARIFLVHAWIVSAVLGLGVGPPVATYVCTSDDLRWPWMFGIGAIVTAVLGAMCFFLQESRPAQVLQSQVKRISKQTGFARLSVDEACHMPTINSFLRTSLWHTFRLFFTQPVVAVVSFMGAFVYGIAYMFSEALNTIYTAPSVADDTAFHLTQRHASLVTLAFVVAVPFTLIPRLFDLRFANQLHRAKTAMTPEHKLLGYYIAAPVFATGLWIFGSTVPPIIDPDEVVIWPSIAALVLIGYGIVEFDTVLSGYLTDAYTSSAASANAPMSFLRAMLSGVFPLFAPKMFKGMGNSQAVYLLAGLATAFCGVAVCFGVFGERLRVGKRKSNTEATAPV